MLAARRLLTDCIRPIMPNYKFRGSWQTWAKQVDLMLRVDGRTQEQVNFILGWLQSPGRNPEFWRTVILSTANLREKWDKLEASIRRDRIAQEHPPSKGERGVQNIAEWARQKVAEREVKEKENADDDG
uniref:Uncharacterized protein n=1 Tax=viral metagenome TaxID=1070528 RepID=A0A6M3J057_9ZZZZ